MKVLYPVKTIVEKLGSIYQNGVEVSHGKIDDGFQDYWKIISSNPPKEIVEEVLKTPEVQRNIPAIRRLYNESEIRSEERFLGSFRPGIPVKEFFGDFTGYVVGECNKAELSQGEKYLVVGCGISPHTQIIATKYFDIRSLGIDNDPTVIERSSRISALFGMGDRMDFQLADGVEFDYGTSNVIFIATMAFPKDQIFARVKETSNPGSRIIARSATGLGTVIMPEVSESLLDGFELMGTYRNPRFNGFESVVVKNK